MWHLSASRCYFTNIHEDFTRIYPSAIPLNSPWQVDMHMFFTLIFITAANMHNIARASGVCGKPELAENTKPVLSYIEKNIGETIRIECAKGYVRKAGTSSLFRCTQQQNSNACWHSDLPLKCILDPRNPPVATTEPTSPHPQVTSFTTERTTSKHPTLHDTSSPTTATGHIALTTTNEVVTTKTRRTSSQPLMSTTKETESITTTNETTTSYTSREYMTTTSSHTLSGSFTTTTGVNASVRTSTISEGGNAGAAFSNATCKCHLWLLISYNHISPPCAN
ncbi:interleukin-15 receptor subunit alpha-like [Carassius carassius]|uniref:interleukin-15 receptor subunit alpha-like n=1 Tax=Carassius carassius TaxID=217509 RepID=UPI0028686A13|nr:interleukin-15 receptor subunit alpha-like [Carassius carassius]